MSYIKNNRLGLGAFGSRRASADAACQGTGLHSTLLGQCKAYYEKGYSTTQIKNMLKAQSDSIKSIEKRKKIYDAELAAVKNSSSQTVASYAPNSKDRASMGGSLCRKQGVPDTLLERCAAYYTEGNSFFETMTILRPEIEGYKSDIASAACNKAGVSPERMGECKELYLSGKTASYAAAMIKQKYEALAKQAAAQKVAAEKAEAEKKAALEKAVAATQQEMIEHLNPVEVAPVINATPAPKKSKATLIAGVGAAGLLLFAVTRKK